MINNKRNQNKDISNIPTNKHNAWFLFTILYLFLDYIRPQDFFPFLGRMKIGFIIVVILCLFILLNLGYSILDIPANIRLIVLFIILLAIHVPFAVNNYWAYVAFIVMVTFLPFIVSTVKVVDNIERLAKMYFTFVFCMLLNAIYSFFHNGLGIGNYFLDENDLTLYINMCLPFAIVLFDMVEKYNIKKILLFGSIIIGVIAVIYSKSRGGFVGLIFMWITMLFFSKNKNKLILLSLVGCVLFIGVGSDKYWDRMSTIKSDYETTNDRIESWKSAWEMFKDNPLGVGGNNFAIRFQEYKTSHFRRNMWGRAVHSLWFQLLSDLGIFGVLLFMMIIYHNMKTIKILYKIKSNASLNWRFYNKISCAFLASHIGFFVSGTFISVLYYAHFWYFTAMLAATLKVAQNDILIT